MRRAWTADFSSGFPTLPGVGPSSGRILQYDLGENGQYLQILRVHDGERAGLFVSARDAIGRLAPDLIVRVGRRVYRMDSRKGIEWVHLETVSEKQTLKVRSRIFGVTAEIELRLPSADATRNANASVPAAASAKALLTRTRKTRTKAGSSGTAAATKKKPRKR